MGFRMILIGLACPALPLRAQSLPDAITIDPSVILTDVSRHPIGIDINYLRDDDHNRPAARPLSSVLKEMGAGMLRYPGGEKSDWQFWSHAPWDRPDPQVNPGYVSDKGTDVLDFDEYMAYARSVGAEPYVVVGYDSFARTGKTKAQYLENAVEWVRYANVVRKYGVKYWEIGNENWNNRTGTAQELAQVVVEFSRAMKAVDPGIRVGASGNNSGWWAGLLPMAAKDMDFLVVSNYACYGWDSFADYRDNPKIDLIGNAANAISAITASAPASERARLVVVAAEANCAYSNAWPNRNDLGHALVDIDMFGQMLLQEKIAYGMLWTTRWMDAEKPYEAFYALGAENEIQPTGRAVAVWGNFLLDKMIAATRTDRIITYASMNAATGGMNVFLLNKDSTARKASVTISGREDYASVAVHRFTGTGDADTHPSWSSEGLVVFSGNKSSVDLPGTSLTVLSLQKRTAMGITARHGDAGFRIGGWERWMGGQGRDLEGRSKTPSMPEWYFRYGW